MATGIGSSSSAAASPVSGAARKLEHADVDVVLVDANDYHSFQPMLYQLATGLLDTTAVAHSLRDLFQHQKNATVHQATVSSVDLERREVQFADMPPLQYDYLVVGLGAVVQFFGCTGAAEHAFPLYTVEDALRLRSHIVGRWEAADRDPSLDRRRGAQRRRRRRRPDGDRERRRPDRALPQATSRRTIAECRPEQARLILVEAGPTLFPMFKPDIREYAQHELEERGVEIMLGERVEAVEPTRVKLASGTVLPAHTLVWGAGLQANPLAESLGVEARERAIASRSIRSCACPIIPRSSSVGDIAWITDAGTGDVLPQLGSVALQAGEHAGENIARIVAGKKPQAVRVQGQGHDGGDRARRRRGAAARRADDEGEAGVPRLGSRPPHAALGVGGPDEGDGRLDLGRLQPRALRADPRRREGEVMAEGQQTSWWCSGSPATWRR